MALGNLRSFTHPIALLAALSLALGSQLGAAPAAAQANPQFSTGAVAAAWVRTAPGGTRSGSGLIPPASPSSIVPLGSSIQARFYANPTNSGAFTARPTDPVVFSQIFPVIDFNPASTAGQCSNAISVNQSTIPFTDVIPVPNGTCFTVAAQGSGHKAGGRGFSTFNTVFTGSVQINVAGQKVIHITGDDGWIFSIGQNVNGKVPARVGGPLNNAPSTSPFNKYPVLAANNVTTSPVQYTVTMNFPATGLYPFELDYSECCGGTLTLVVS